MSTPIDSAIAPHLRRTRTNPRRMRSADYRPEFESFTSRLAESVTSLTIGYFGVQSLDSGETSGAADELEELLDRECGPVRRDRARFVDQLGYATRIVIAYWDVPGDFEKWYGDDGFLWTSPDRLRDGVGFFTEVVRPTVDRLETIFTSPSKREGLADLADAMEPFVEHGYWGSMRDRLPITQIDPVVADGKPEIVAAGKLTVIQPQENLCLIRSGQDFSETTGGERAFYLDEIEPTLRAGMDFLRDDGLSVGCFANRYLDVIDESGRFLDKRFAMSWWNDMSDLEGWSKSHPTHARIFEAAMRHMTEFGTAAKLHLYHEVVVVDRDQQIFEYLNCHHLTGLLACVGSR
jgi:aldoxime dehydratase